MMQYTNGLRQMSGAMLRTFCRGANTPRLGYRQIHQLPSLSNQQRYEQEGIAGVYSKDGFRDIWTEYQQYLVDELSRQTAETEHETRTPFGIMVNTAEKMLDTSIFNFASQAHNNHLYIEGLRPVSVGEDGKVLANPTQPSPALLRRIEETFGSMEGLRQEMVDIATGPETNGAGWLFLVEKGDKTLDLVHVFQAGSPYFVGRMQQNDFNLGIGQEASEELQQIKEEIEDKVREYTMPLVAVNLWEVAYLSDYGVGGKTQFIENVWNALNWDVINERYYGN